MSFIRHKLSLLKLFKNLVKIVLFHIDTLMITLKYWTYRIVYKWTVGRISMVELFC